MMHKTAFIPARAIKVSPVVGNDPQGADQAQSGDNPRVLRALATDPRIVVLHGTLLSLVRRDGRDLTARQLTAFMSVYMDEQTHTVSSLAELLHISRPGVTRIMDRLVQFDLVAREEDREDRRRVLVRRTTRGAAFFRELVTISRAVAAELHDAQGTEQREQHAIVA
jgi:DNA-binding MarR family transcriptional regulator